MAKVKLSNVKGEAWSLIRSHRRSLTIGLILMVIGRLAAFVLPMSTKFIIDEVITLGRAELLLPIAGAVLLATLVQAATGFAVANVVSVAAQRAIAELRLNVQQHVLRLPTSYFDSTKSGVLISRIMTDPEGIRNLVGTGIIQLVGGIFTATIALAALLYFNWQLTLGTVLLLVVFAAVMSIAFKKLRPIFRERGEINAQVTGRLGETLGGVRLVKVYVAEKREESVFNEGVMRLYRNIASTITGTSLVSSLSTVIVGGVSLIIIIGGGRAALAGEMTPGELITFTFLVGMMVAPLVNIASIGTQITDAFAGLDRIRELRDVLPEDADDANREPLGEVSGTVGFRNVSFAYGEGPRVLEDITFEAPAGTTTALVGPSGAGKSTLISLIMAFHYPDEGTILIDGHDLSRLRLLDYRRQLGVVMQDNFLFDGTIRENIAYARPDATDDEIRAAARVANADEFIDRFDDGYDTVVGERGVKLSGGQRQRLAIARAIIADPRLLILDEATSSLDSESEALIRDGLQKLRQGRTTFVIAHRLSTIQSANQILVLDGGRIVERGTHRELLRRGGLYRSLYERQQGLERDIFMNPGEDPVPGRDEWAGGITVADS
ncbi:MAG TPA: ABC transporter ATP-binding protein [Longimicrobiales bacterium]|nr:ABC transporter ATP-binding protein [Longimicrobiales bacterium]